MQKLYAITVENSDTDDREEHVWNQTATSPADALRESDNHLRVLGWASGWKSTAALLIGEGIQKAPSSGAIVETIEPGTVEWELSEIALEKQRRHGR